MSKVLNRKMFRQKYLGVQKPQGFQTGGVAEAAKLDISDEEVQEKLDLEKTEPEVETPVKTEDKDFATGVASVFGLQDTPGGLTRNQKLQSYIAPIAAALLTGDQRAGESKLSGTLRALGLGMATLPGTIQTINKSDLEARKLGKEEAAAAAKGSEQIVSLEQARQLKVSGLDGIPVDSKGFVKIKTVVSADGVTRNQLADAPNITESFAKDILPKASKDILKPARINWLSTLTQLENKIDKYVKNGEAIPGVGPLGSGYMEGVFDADAKEIRGILQDMKNLKIKELSGAAVSAAEAERLAKAFNEGSFSTEQDLVNFLVRARAVAKKGNDVYIKSYKGFENSITDQLAGIRSFDISPFAEFASPGVRDDLAIMEQDEKDAKKEGIEIIDLKDIKE